MELKALEEEMMFGNHHVQILQDTSFSGATGIIIDRIVVDKSLKLS